MSEVPIYPEYQCQIKAAPQHIAVRYLTDVVISRQEGSMRIAYKRRVDYRRHYSINENKRMDLLKLETIQAGNLEADLIIKYGTPMPGIDEYYGRIRLLETKKPTLWKRITNSLWKLMGW